MKNRQRYSTEFKAEICKLVMAGRRTVAQVSNEHSICPSSVYGWVRQARIDQGVGLKGTATTSELEELRRLRKENRVLQQERDFLVDAARYFAAAKK